MTCKASLIAASCIAVRDGIQTRLAEVEERYPGDTGRARRMAIVDGGRVRDHGYQVAAEPETVTLGELSYSTLRVARTNGGNDDTVVWVARGVPTPVRILQREDGEDAVDLRLVEYK